MFITGHADNAALDDGLPEHRIRVMTKPFAVKLFASRAKESIGTTRCCGR